VTYNKYDMNVGLWPYNVVVTPNGKLALVNNNGNAGSADGQIDTVSVIDLEANPPRVTTVARRSVRLISYRELGRLLPTPPARGAAYSPA